MSKQTKPTPSSASKTFSMMPVEWETFSSAPVATFETGFHDEEEEAAVLTTNGAVLDLVALLVSHCNAENLVWGVKKMRGLFERVC